MTRRTLRLRHLLPSQWASSLASRPFEWQQVLQGLESFNLDDPARKIVLVGQPDALKSIEQLTRLMDKPVRRVRLEARVIKTGRSLSDKEIMAVSNVSPTSRAFPMSVVLTEGCAHTESGSDCTLRLFARGQFFLVNALPHANEDRSVSLTATISREEIQAEGDVSENSTVLSRSFRRLQPGQSLIVSADRYKKTENQHFLLLTAFPTR